MSTYDTPDALQTAKMQEAMGVLGNDLDSLGAALNSTSVLTKLNNAFTSNTSGEAANFQYDKWKAQVADLGDRQFDQVVNGTQSLEGWFGTARALHDAISSTTADTDNWSFGTIVSNTASATATDVKKVATVGALVATPIILVVGVLALVIILGRR